ncbi:hypothetical protein, partial [Pseudoduganella ginsengisoli]|uniref:hypothetical protein n=1 Tax=Pseudoduganella ginsengisoli TaxID=1462440 RepID=UPI0014792829
GNVAPAGTWSANCTAWPWSTWPAHELVNVAGATGKHIEWQRGAGRHLVGQLHGLAVVDVAGARAGERGRRRRQAHRAATWLAPAGTWLANGTAWPWSTWPAHDLVNVAGATGKRIERWHRGKSSMRYQGFTHASQECGRLRYPPPLNCCQFFQIQ